MFPRILMVALVALLLADVKSVQAGKVPSRRTEFLKNTGARTDITVPYGTNGFSTLGVYQGVGPIIYGGPAFGTTGSTLAQPVYNLPFYGAVMSFSPLSNGATSRPPNNLRGN